MPGSALLLAVAALAGFEKTVLPLVEKHCVKCHGAEKQKGGIDLRDFKNEGAALKKFKLWRQVIEQVRADEMPPDDDTGWNDDAKRQLLGGVQKTLALLDSDSPALRDPGPALIRRLSRSEYTNALRDLLGWEIDLSKSIGLPEDSTGGPFDNAAAALTIQPALLEKYFAAADFALGEMFPEPAAIKRDDYESKERAKKAKAAAERLLKDVSTDRSGAQQILSQLARRAWRRPLAPAETERFAKIFDAASARGDTFPLALRKAIKPILVSPNFLFRLEADRPAEKVAKVSDLELATRLSFFIWSSLPDEELLALAEKNQLSAPTTLAAQVRRLLADPRARALTDNFFIRWLELDKLAAARPSTEFFPTFNAKLKTAMRQEVETFCNKLREEDRSVLDLLNADYTYASEDLAKHYGLPGITGKDAQRVALPADGNRGGVLGMAGVLALTSHTSRTSPTLRGKYVLDVIFGTPPNPPPANVSQIDEKKKSKDGTEPKNFREKLALHAADAACAGCHRKIDPLGFGLENYDAIGAWRPSGADLDTSGELPGGKKFDGAAGLRALVWERRADFERNLAAQLLRYALGRELDYFDERTLTRIQQSLDKDGHKFSALVLGIVNSFPFQHRRNAEPH